MIVTNQRNHWKLGDPKKMGVPNFTSINPTSVHSMSVYYDDDFPQDEHLITPVVELGGKPQCSFYAAFDGVFTNPYLGASFSVSVIDPVEKDTTEIWDASTWSDANGHERPKWVFIQCDLEKYANQSLKFCFSYVGMGGDDVVMDDFKVTNEGGAQASILEGECVHFEPTLPANAKSYLWTLPGSVEGTSTDRTPEIRYMTKGSYDVTLEIIDQDGNKHTKTIEDFVIVDGVAPIAAIGFPTDAHLSPYVGMFVPTNQELTFSDNSTHVPTAWKWTLPGATIANPDSATTTAVYTQEGIYDIALQVANEQGADQELQQEFIQAGGSQYIWNIGLDEGDKLGHIGLSFYGNYGGTNWLDMKAFAEIFVSKYEVSVDSVDIFFDKTTTVTPDAEIVVSIYDSKDGMPNKALASDVLLAKDLVYDADYWLPTGFAFDSPVVVKDTFFVVISGIPNNTDEKTNESDDIAMGTVGRKEGEKNTCYHLLEEWDDNNKPTGKCQWFANTDNPASFAITPRLTFSNSTAIINPEIEQINEVWAYTYGNTIYWAPTTDVRNITLHDMTGGVVWSALYASHINTSSLKTGVYILSAQVNGKQMSQKIVL